MLRPFFIALTFFFLLCSLTLYLWSNSSCNFIASGVVNTILSEDVEVNVRCDSGFLSLIAEYKNGDTELYTAFALITPTRVLLYDVEREFVHSNVEIHTHKQPYLNVFQYKKISKSTVIVVSRYGSYGFDYRSN